jgi:hypothetical protein
LAVGLDPSEQATLTLIEANAAFASIHRLAAIDTDISRVSADALC